LLDTGRQGGLRTGLLRAHYYSPPTILQYLKSDVAHIIFNGRIVSTGHPDAIIPKIEAVGYESYVKSIGDENHES